MASIFATMYVKMIKIGKRTVDDVRPDELKQEVIDLLIEEGRDDLAGVEEPKEDEGSSDKKEDKPSDGEYLAEPIPDDKDKE